LWVSVLWIPQIPSVTNAIEISVMRKGTGGWLRRRPGSNNVTFEGKPLDGVFVMHRKPNPWGHMAPQPSTWRGRSEQILLNQVGCEARKIPADAEVFFLDFSFYRTYQHVD